MSRIAITLKFKMCLFIDEASYWAEKLLTDINLPPLLPDNKFGGSLGLDLENDDVTCNSRILQTDTFDGCLLILITRTSVLSSFNINLSLIIQFSIASSTSVSYVPSNGRNAKYNIEYCLHTNVQTAGEI